MKKKLIATTILLSIFLTGCGNRQVLIDTHWTFTKAKIDFGGEILEIELESWKDYDDTTIQLVDKDGNVYLTDIKNVLMTNK